MTIEDKIEENSNQLRQVAILLLDGINVMKAIAAGNGETAQETADTYDRIVELRRRNAGMDNNAAPKIITEDFGELEGDEILVDDPLNISVGNGNADSLPTVDLNTSDTAAPAITTEDFGELDAMGCPFDPNIMAKGRTKNKSGKLAGCWKKKKDASYTEEMYLKDRRVLIEKAAGVAGDDTEETTTDAPPPPPPPAALEENAAPPPPMTAVTDDIAELPSIPDFDAITNEAFVDLCRVFIIKHGDEGARCLTENMGKCGAAVGLTPDKFNQQDQMSWVAKKVVDYDATHA